MPSTYSSNLKIELMSTGENSGTWGNITNTNLGTALEQAIVGYGAVSYASDANLTISITNSNAAQAARALVLNVTSAVSLTATRELVVPTSEKQYIVQNNTTGSQSITVKTSAGTGITVPNGRKAHLYVDGTNVIQMFDFVDINGGTIDGTSIGASSASTGAFTTLNASGATTLDGNVTLGNASGDNVTVTGTITSHLLFTDNTYDIGANGATRPRNLFLAGAATIGGNLSVGGTLTLTGGLILNGNVTVGDSSADTLTVNATITSNLLFTDNTYDIGASGATRPRNLFLAGNATIGGNQTLTGSLTVDSTTDSSSTTTGSIQTDGGLGVAKALYVGTTANIAGNVTLSGGTANGVAYLNGSKVLTTGSALTFDGTNLGVGAAPSNYAGYSLAAIGNTSGGGLQLRTSGAAFTEILASSTEFYQKTVGAATPIWWGINNVEQMRLTSTGLGIGTSSPAQKLSVATASGNAYMRVERASQSTGQVGLQIGGGTSSTDWFMYVPTSSNTLTWFGNSLNLMSLDTSGNLGLGVTPSAWGSSVKALQFDYGAFSASSSVGTEVDGNCFYNGTNWIYRLNGRAFRYNQADAGHAWFTAPSGTAGNAISFTQAMTLDSSGNLIVNGTSPVGKLTVSGQSTDANNVLTGANIVAGTQLALRERGNSNGISGAPYVQQIYSGPSGDNLEIYTAASKAVVFGTAATERARITSGGLMGLGMTPTGSYSLQIYGIGASTGSARIRLNNSSTGTADADGGGIAMEGVDMVIQNSENGVCKWEINGSERCRITSGGDLLVNRTSTLGTAKFVVEADTTTANPMTVSNSRSTAATDYSILFYRNASLVGSVQTSLTATSYVTSSDYRLKENIQPMTGALTKVAALKPVTYKWKATGGEADGFIAHELAEVCPQAVTGEKDAVDADGNPQYQGIDTSFLVATLTAAIQELKAEFDAYKATHP